MYPPFYPASWLFFVSLLGIEALRAHDFDVADVPRGMIAFSSVAPRHLDLYQVRLSDKNEGRSEKRLTHADALDYNAAIAPDGQQLAFVSERHGNVDLYRMNLDGTGLTRLTKNQAMDDHPAWSPDSRHLVFVSTRQRAPVGRAWNGLYVMRADGTDLRRISKDAAADYSPAWSPRGDLLAFVSGASMPEDLYVMRPNGSERRLLVKDGGWPTFVNQGAAVCFHRRNDEGQWDLWQINIDGTALKRIVENASMPRATADGSLVAFVNRSATPQHISILAMDDSEIADVAPKNGEAAHWNPTLSPDGTILIYHRATAGKSNPSAEWWAAPPETALHLLRLDGAFPGFAPDKKRVAFISQSFSRVDVMDIDGANRSTIFEGTHRSLFGVSWSQAP